MIEFRRLFAVTPRRASGGGRAATLGAAGLKLAASPPAPSPQIFEASPNPSRLSRISAPGCPSGFLSLLKDVLPTRSRGKLGAPKDANDTGANDGPHQAVATDRPPIERTHEVGVKSGLHAVSLDEINQNMGGTSQRPDLSIVAETESLITVQTVPVEPTNLMLSRETLSSKNAALRARLGQLAKNA